MSIVYFDNFRGFESTYLPLQEVNFFVGENSTGKSSILKLIGILSSPGFWRYNIFGEEETGLGTFSEIKTASTTKIFFDIGLLGNKSSSHHTSAFKIRFVEEDSYPAVKEICYRDEIINIQATVEASTLKYRFQQIEDNQSIPENNLELFEHWIKNNGLKNEPFSRTIIDNNSLEQLLYQLSFSININLKEAIDEVSQNHVKISIPNLYNNMAWFAPTVLGPQKAYVQAQLVFNALGKHSASVLRSIIFEDEHVQNILNRFGKDSGLYENIRINNLSSESEDSFEIQVFINNKALNITNVGYGVSQILPLIIEAIARPNNSWIVSQQPETHLHPMAQAAIGDFMFKSNEVDGQKFIIETHSDYIIDRFRLRLNRSYQKDKSKTNPTCQIVFFSKSEAGNSLHTLPVKEDGSYSEKQPAGFRDFFIKEQFDLIKI